MKVGCCYIPCDVILTYDIDAADVCVCVCVCVCAVLLRQLT